MQQRLGLAGSFDGGIVCIKQTLGRCEAAAALEAAGSARAKPAVCVAALPAAVGPALLAADTDACTAPAATDIALTCALLCVDLANSFASLRASPPHTMLGAGPQAYPASRLASCRL